MPCLCASYIWLNCSCAPCACLVFACTCKGAHLAGMPGQHQHEMPGQQRIICQISNIMRCATPHRHTPLVRRVHLTLCQAGHVAVNYDHEVQPGDASLSSHLANVGHIAGMWLTLLACASCCLSPMLRHLPRTVLHFSICSLSMAAVSCFQTHVHYRSLVT